jgi:hypothetical protein
MGKESLQGIKTEHPWKVKLLENKGREKDVQTYDG